jgi:hypothetical protein
MGYCILASVWMSSEAVNSTGTTVEQFLLRVTFFDALSICVGFYYIITAPVCMGYY